MAEIHQLFVFEVARGIDLEQAERQLGRLGKESQRPLFRHRGRVTSFFQYRPAPLRVSQEHTPITVEGWKTDPVVDLVLYDFGAASIAYHVPVPGGLDALYAATLALQGISPLRQDARARVEALVQSVGGAAQRPRIAEFSEDYRIIGLREGTGDLTATAFCDYHAETIARILRPDAGRPSAEEVRHATEVRISFGASDVTIVDWDAAFVLDPDPEDVRAVLEFANVQLLEMRWLDLQLDNAVERSYQLLGRPLGWRTLLPRSLSANQNLVAELQLESVVVFERVSNALKVFGEEYLARIYRLAAARFRLGELDATITRKLATIESIYQKLTDRASTVRLEFLEWVVIILIASEIVLGLVRH
jgi:hypothetical protein